jgi:hypothetical protein
VEMKLHGAERPAAAHGRNGDLGPTFCREIDLRADLVDDESEVL